MHSAMHWKYSSLWCNKCSHAYNLCLSCFGIIFTNQPVQHTSSNSYSSVWHWNTQVASFIWSININDRISSWFDAISPWHCHCTMKKHNFARFFRRRHRRACTYRKRKVIECMFMQFRVYFKLSDYHFRSLSLSR